MKRRAQEPRDASCAPDTLFAQRSVTAQISAARQLAQVRLDKGGNPPSPHRPERSGGGKAQLFEHPFHDGIRACARRCSRPTGSHPPRFSPSAAIPSSVKLTVTCSVRHQRGVLQGQGVVRLGQDADEILFGQGTQIDPDRQAPLQFPAAGPRVWRYESAGRDEQEYGRVLTGPSLVETVDPPRSGAEDRGCTPFAAGHRRRVRPALRRPCRFRR